jgi:anti-sigma factor RsiW
MASDNDPDAHARLADLTKLDDAGQDRYLSVMREDVKDQLIKAAVKILRDTQIERGTPGKLGSVW